MSELDIQVLAGLVVVLTAGAAGFLLRIRFPSHDQILLGPSHHIDTNSYSHLDGSWHFYWISYGPSDGLQPIWLHGTQELQVQKHIVKGTAQHVNYPVDDLHYLLTGEIRFGRMIITDTSLEDESDYASVFFSNLRSKTLLIGIWTGLDNLLRPISAPAILSRKEMSSNELNDALRTSLLILVPIDQCK